MLKKIWNWVIYSSANAEEISLTVKGVLLGIVPAVIILGNLAHVTFTSDQLTHIIDGIVAAIGAIGLIVSAIMTLYGLLRKLATTSLGTNEVR